jgi:hypothetical protein
LYKREEGIGISTTGYPTHGSQNVEHNIIERLCTMNLQHGVMPIQAIRRWLTVGQFFCEKRGDIMLRGFASSESFGEEGMRKLDSL